MNEHLWTTTHLPWYVNDTLVGEERERVQAHLSDCLVCRQELHAVQLMAKTVAAEVPPPADAALAFAQVNDRIDRHSGNGLRALMRNTPGSVKWLVAVQAVLLAGIGGWFMQRDLPLEEPVYRTLSSAALPAGDLRIVFAPWVDAKQRAAWLTEQQADIVYGPSDSGVYAVRWPTAPDAQLLHRLRNEPRIVFVEPSAPLP